MTAISFTSGDDHDSQVIIQLQAMASHGSGQGDGML
jgi:hypothetical protein